MKFTILAFLLASSLLLTQSADAQTLSLGSALQLELETPPRPPTPPRAPRTPHLAVATTLGGLAGVAGGFGLAWGPALISDNDCQSSEHEFCGIRTAFILMGTSWATPATTALGIWAGGRAAGGRGNYGLTLLGSAIGGTAGAGFAVLGISRDSRGAAIAGFMAVPVLQWVGGLIAYHMSHNASEARRRERRVMPMVQVEQRGASLQLSGAF